MRRDKKLTEKLKRRKEYFNFIKKMSVFFLIFFFIVGLVTVDEAYSEIMGTTGQLSLQIRRLDQDKVIFSLFGKESIVNVSKVEEKIDDIQTRAYFFLEDLTGRVRTLLGFEEWPREDIPFASKTL
ncbi:MAG: hypothetical protein GX363_07220 [Clostridiales bacterium]|jgi:flagellar biosynthesis protein FlhB|nr:hypothetical protein [Clostridiales bacterium]